MIPIAKGFPIPTMFLMGHSCKMDMSRVIKGKAYEMCKRRNKSITKQIC